MSEISQRTVLYDEHVALGARMVPFAGYDMPVQYPMGILNEHKWTRENAGLFDVSHMGQASFFGSSSKDTALELEKLVPADLQGMAVGQIRYTQLLNEQGGVIDDLMIARHSDDFELVVNAGRKEIDYAHIRSQFPSKDALSIWEDLSLLAIQGPKAEAVLVQMAREIADLKFMHFIHAKLNKIGVVISRSGYTGEDGFEISVHNENVNELWALLLSDERVKPIGLGARDSLRLEAGLCLYGHDIDETTSPIEAGLQWSIPKQRRIDGGFIGAERVQRELAAGVSRKRVGIKPEGRAPARDGTEVQDLSGRKIGIITSGGFGPTVNGPVAMGYVETASAVVGTKIQLIVRGQALPAVVCALPFVPNTFKR
ncbi:MAG: glycine cleavage system aminomethyltransferase GcvT [Aestuariivirga sp.]